MRIAPLKREAFGKDLARSFAEALITKTRDPHWGVRVQSVQALGHVWKAYPEELSSNSEELNELWFSRLKDNVGAVRESAAIVLS
jgi:hypothetical protein